MNIFLTLTLAATLFFWPMKAIGHGKERLCRDDECHPTMGQEGFVHGPVAVVQCDPCHRPKKGYRPEKHGPEDFEFVAAGKRMCLNCHGQMKRKIASPLAHAALNSSDCLICHVPHQSANRFQLKEPFVADLCTGCHKNLGLRIQGSRFAHGPLKLGRCEQCHNPHSSGCQDLLIVCNTGESSFWGSKENAAFVSVCWKCHSPASFTDRTKSDTGFRNGNLNLHFVHVVQKRQRDSNPCKRCHEIHSGNTDYLIREDVCIDRGVWSFPLNFKKSSSGGTCKVECHRPLSYDREKPLSY